MGAGETDSLLDVLINWQSPGCHEVGSLLAASSQLLGCLRLSEGPSVQMPVDFDKLAMTLLQGSCLAVIRGARTVANSPRWSLTVTDSV